jgi:tetratricopeptide (TPR) repeat protein
MARANARMGRDEVAQRLFLRLKPDAWQAEDLLLIAAGLMRQGRTQLARDNLGLALRADPFHPEALQQGYRICAQEERWEEAARLAGRLATVPRWEVIGEVLLGGAWEALDDPQGAAEALVRALGRDPTLRNTGVDPGTARKRLAHALLRLGRPGDASRHLEADPALRDDPETAWLLSRAYLPAGELPRATAALGSARAFRPEDPMVPEPARYVGAAQCARCHAAIHRAEQGSRHARTFLAGADIGHLDLPEHPIADPVRPEVSHALRRDGDRLRAEAVVEGETLRAFVDYALGSGDRGMTLVGRDADGRSRELRISRYARGTIWDLTTGHDPHPRRTADWLGRPLEADELRRCLDCHTTRASSAAGRSGPEAADRGIGCERCHGPAGNHLAAVASGFSDLAIARPRLAPAARVVALCGSCHGPRDSSPAPTDPGAARFQAPTLTRSRCYTESDGRLSCTTCHDPHRDASPLAASYEARCLSCHEPPRAPAPGPALASSEGKPRSVCPVNPTSNCLECHMPRVDDAVRHSSFTDHYIRIHPAERSSPPRDPTSPNDRDRS